MRIEEELKLDYSDVLFRPKRSTLSSRKEVDLHRTYKFKYSKNEWTGIPIMAANIDGVGELGVAENLSEFNMITSLTKQHDVKKLTQYKNLKSIYKNIALSTGIKKEDWRGNYQWENSSEIIIYDYVNTHDGSLEILELNSKLYEKNLITYFEKIGKWLDSQK
jgi:hypothetical protein